MAKQVTLTIDGIKVTVPEGLSVVDAAKTVDLAADADGDGVVTPQDVQRAMERYVELVSAAQVSPLALCDGDGDLDLADLQGLGRT